MAKNIYDLFNERKYGVDYLVEGVDGNIEEAEAFESIEEAADAILNIAQESANEAIELQAAWYLEDLVIESMMYDNFEEERISSVMEGSIKEKASKAADYIKRKWQQIKEWFASTFKAIANHFTNGEKLVNKNKALIPKAIASSNAKVKMPKIMGNPDDANSKCNKMVSDLKASRISGEKGKEQVLKVIGVEDRKSVGEKVKGFFFGASSERPIKEYYNQADLLMKWAGGKKAIIDSFKKQQKQVDDDFKETLAKLKKDAKADGAGDKEAEIVKNFNFALNLKNTILSAQLHCNKQMCSMALSIIRRALNSGGAAAEDQKLLDNRMADYDAKKQADFKRKQDIEDAKREAGVGQDDDNDIEGPNESYIPQFEAFEIIEVEEDTNDWDW